MNLKVPILDKWAVFNDVLVGEAIDHPNFETRRRVMTNKCFKLDKAIGMARCSSGEVWQLGQPGHLGMYVDPVTKRFF